MCGPCVSFENFPLVLLIIQLVLLIQVGLVFLVTQKTSVAVASAAARSGQAVYNYNYALNSADENTSQVQGYWGISGVIW